MNECWCALTLAVLNYRFITPDAAFDILQKGKKQKRKHISKVLTNEDIKDMARLRETMTYKQIGAIYGMKADAVYSRLRRFKEI